MSELFHEWIRAGSLAWTMGEQGQLDEAYRCYQYMDELMRTNPELNGVTVNPELSMIRHGREMPYQGIVSPYSPTEDAVISIELQTPNAPLRHGEGAIDLHMDVKRMAMNIDNYEPRIYPETGPYTDSKLFFISTGRCGTVSLYRLFEKTDYTPYHSYFYQPSVLSRYEFLCNFAGYGDVDLSRAEAEYGKTRIAEMTGARRTVMLNHMDTIFAPYIARAYPCSKIIHLHRDPEEAFKSFYMKKQWNDAHITNLVYQTEPFAYGRVNMDLPVQLAWYLKFTEKFAEAIELWLAWKGEQSFFQRISADKLFAQDEEEIQRFIEFTEIDLSIEEVKQHFAIPHNKKAHKIQVTGPQLDAALDQFRRAYAAL